MVYQWCTQCLGRDCANESSHRAQRLLQYRADFRIGGRFGKRIRKMFDNKKDAEAYQYVTLADFKRGTFLPVDKSPVSFEEFYKDYEEKHIIRHMKGAREEKYRLGSFRAMFNKYPMTQFKLKDWDKYLPVLEQKNSKVTINRYLTSIKIMFNWAVKNKYIKENPFTEVRKFKVDDVRARWLDDGEIEKILAQCTMQKDLDLRDILVFALNTGFRRANLERVTAHDIFGQRVQATRTKSGKPYDVPINQESATLINRLVLARPSGPLLNFKNFRKRFDAVVTDSSVTLHTFRHTFAAQCLKRGIPIDRVCKWLGHHSMEFTRSRYGHLSPNQEHIEINLLNLGRHPATNVSVPELQRGHIVDTDKTEELQSS